VFARGRGAGGNWVGAFTRRHKLILSQNDPPWLLDLQRDPDERTNFCAEPASRETVGALARDLLDYGRRFNDPRVSHPTVASDLARLAAADAGTART
jgi:uncharacterized sulfatase